MLAWMLEAGADATQPTRTPSSEAPLHVACAKRNVRALELLLDSLARSENLQEALRQAAPGRARSTREEPFHFNMYKSHKEFTEQN